MWDLVAGRETYKLAVGDPKSLMSAGLSSDGKTLAIGRWGAPAEIWDVAAGQRIQTLDTDTHFSSIVTLSPDGNLLASVEIMGGMVRVTEWRTARSVALLTASGEIGAVSFSPDGRWLGVGVKKEGVELWDARAWTGGRLLRGYGGEISDLAFSGDGEWVGAVGEEDGPVTIWSAESGSVLGSIGGWDSVHRVSGDRRWMFQGGRGLVKELLSLVTGQRQQMKGLQAERAAALSPDGRWLAVPTERAEIGLWESAFGMLTRRPESIPLQVTCTSPGTRVQSTFEWCLASGRSPSAQMANGSFLAVTTHLSGSGRSPQGRNAEH